MILKGKVAVVYGAAGDIGGAVSREFASEGAQVFLTGRKLEPLEKIATEIRVMGGSAVVAVVDALDEKAIEEHLKKVTGSTGRIDISLNAIGIPPTEILGTNLADITLEKFMRAAGGYPASYFLTARAAARHMIPQKRGVIMNITSLPARFGSRMNGGYGAGQGAKDALTRDLSAELAPHGIRVLGLRPHGIPASRTMRELHEAKGEAMGITFDQFSQYLAGMSHTKRVMELKDVGGVAAFMASDRASGITGTNVNLTMGSLDD